MVNDPPSKQIALVLQGGGALGAYEVGALKVLCKKLVQSKRSSNEEKDRPFFSSIQKFSSSFTASFHVFFLLTTLLTSIAAFIAPMELPVIISNNGLSSTPDFSNWWRDKSKKQKAFNASAEAARRYYSVKEYLEHGTPNVCSGPEPELV